MFEGLLSTFPKRLDIWNQLLDLEIQPKGAKAWFRRWSEWEENNGDKKTQEKVRAKAEEWVRAAAERKVKSGDDEQAE